MFLSATLPSVLAERRIPKLASGWFEFIDLRPG
jgi:hypothetical protein